MFELIFTFHERRDDGSYDMEKSQTFVKKVGLQTEETPVEKAAAVVMRQLARRDVLVKDVEVFEFVKKKISFKETKGGITIKNRRFMLDGTASLEDTELVESSVEMEQRPQRVVQPHLPPAMGRQEIFDSDPGILAPRGIKLTQRKAYTIYKEKTVQTRVNIQGQGMTEMPGFEYEIIDDAGKRVSVSSVHFIPMQGKLIGDELIHRAEMERSSNGNRPKLLFQAEDGGMNMPVLR